MLLTEEEAKAKWCPFSRGIMDQGGNRTAYGSADDTGAEKEVASALEYAAEMAAMYPCIASACMAWREHVVPEHQENIYDQPDRPDGDGWVPFSQSERNCAWARVIPEKRGGYCGLAGKVGA
jgi:hypothetical protein